MARKLLTADTGNFANQTALALAAEQGWSGGQRVLPTGAIAQAFDRATPTANINLLSSGRISLCGIYLPAGITVSSISFLSGTTPLAGGNNQWFALFDASRNLLAISADDTATAWAANTVKTLAVSYGPIATAGVYYAGIMVNAGTVPTLTVAQSGANMTGLLPKLCGSCDTGLTNPASCPNPPNNFLTGSSVLPYFYVS